MKRLYYSMAREFKLIFRDGITAYLTIAPALLALVFVLIFGSMQRSVISLAVDNTLPQELTARLEQVAEVTYYNTLQDLQARVSGVDSIAGVTMQNGQIRLIVEGNEAAGFAAQRQQLVSAALGNEPIAYTAQAVTAGQPLAYTISMASVFLLALFIGGAALGLGGVTERESGVIHALSISPITLAGYLLSKLLPALLFGTLGVSAAALILGRADTLPQFLLLALCSVFVSGIIILLLVALAGNQIAAVGVLKLMMPVFLVLGVSAVFVPEQWLFLYFALPMYWQYAAIDAILSGGQAAMPLLMIIATGFAWFIPALLLFNKRIPLNTRR